MEAGGLMCQKTPIRLIGNRRFFLIKIESNTFGGLNFELKFFEKFLNCWETKFLVFKVCGYQQKNSLRKNFFNEVQTRIEVCILPF